MHEGAINWWGLGSQYAEQPALGWSLLTFAIFVALLVYALKKPLANYLEVRSEEIRHAIEEARAAKAKADQRVQEYEQKLKSLDAESARLRLDFIEQGKKEKVMLEESAKRLAQQIAKDTDETIRAELMRAFASLKSEAATIAVELAAKEIQASVRSQGETQLYDRFLNETSAR